MAVAVGITGRAVDIAVLLAQTPVIGSQVLNEGRPRDDCQPLHAPAQAQDGYIMVEAVSHCQVF